MNYTDNQRKFCQLVAGMNVVLTREWSKGECGFAFGWNTTWSRYINNRVLKVVEITEHGVCVNPIDSGAFIVLWFVLEAVYSANIAETSAVTVVPKNVEVVYPKELDLESRLQANIVISDVDHIRNI